MRPFRTTALALALAVALTACSGSDGDDGGAVASADGPASPAPTATDRPATVATSAAGAASSTGTAASGECATLVEAITEMSGTWQIYVQLPGIPDVARWKTIIEPMGLKHTFTETLDTLNGAFGSDKDVADAIGYMRTADGIVQKGVGGEASAIAELKSHIGENVMEALLKQAPISKALGAKGC